MEELKITKERILEAASRCSQAKQTLEVLFPEAFNKPIDEMEVYIKKAIEPLSKFINSTIEFDYKLWQRIPGNVSLEKADWIMNSVKEGLKKEGKWTSS